MSVASYINSLFGSSNEEQVKSTTDEVIATASDPVATELAAEGFRDATIETDHTAPLTAAADIAKMATYVAEDAAMAANGIEQDNIAAYNAAEAAAAVDAAVDVSKLDAYVAEDAPAVTDPVLTAADSEDSEVVTDPAIAADSKDSEVIADPILNVCDGEVLEVVDPVLTACDNEIPIIDEYYIPAEGDLEEEDYGDENVDEYAVAPDSYQEPVYLSQHYDGF
jgi:hypothetical protein